MRIYNKYLLSLGITLSFINIGLGVWGQRDFGVYFTFETLAFLVITLAFNLNPRTRDSLRPIGAILFIGFLAVIIYKISLML